MSPKQSSIAPLLRVFKDYEHSIFEAEQTTHTHTHTGKKKLQSLVLSWQWPRFTTELSFLKIATHFFFFNFVGIINGVLPITRKSRFIKSDFA